LKNFARSKVIRSTGAMWYNHGNARIHLFRPSSPESRVSPITVPEIAPSEATVSDTTASETTLPDTTLPENLAPLGFSPELAEVISPDEFREETERAWKTVLQELKGEKPANNRGRLTLQMFTAPAEVAPGSDSSGAAKAGALPTAPVPLGAAAAHSPSPIPMGEGPSSLSGEGSSSSLSSSATASANAATPDKLDTLDADDDARFPFYSAAQLNSGQFETRYLIPGILAAAQPGGIFGAFKTLKTSLTADLLISLASGTPFLGHFDVAEPGRTLFLSGESGLAALQSIARRICTARGLSLETLDNFELSPKLPNLDSSDDMRALGRIVRKKWPVCIAIDPAYLAIRGEDARNLFAMGSLLRPLAELCNDTGCTILIVHHCKRSRVVPGDPATLDDIAWSGFAEFSAQWLLLARRRRYDPDTGHHELWFSAGGRAGHHGLCALDIDEGRPDDGELANPPAIAEFRIWKTALRRVSSAQTQSEKQIIDACEDRRARRSDVVLKRDRRRLVKAMFETCGPVTARYLRDRLGINGLRIRQVLCSLLKDGLLTEVTHHTGYRTEVRYKVSESVSSVVNSEANSAESPNPPSDQDLSSGSGHIVSLGS
jgi:AAA domain